MIKKLKDKYIYMVGNEESVKNFKSKFPLLHYIDDTSAPPTLNDKCFVVTGPDWKCQAQELEKRGYIFWTDIFPDWAFTLIKNNGGHVEFESIKRFCRTDNDEIADIFEYISRYKKICVIYGNCQSIYLSFIFEKSKQFTSDYIICRFLPIMLIKDEKETGFSKQYMSKISLFIYQHAAINNAFGEKLSTQTILPLLSPRSVKISIPFIYWSGYFPQHIKNVRNDDDKRGGGHAPYGDIKIQSYLEDGLTVEEVSKRLQSPDLYSKKEVLDNMYASFDELKKREEKCDIKISDFIEKNYEDNYLFYSPSHPTNFTQYELVKRILKRLGYQDEAIDYSDVLENDKYQMYIYPSVRRALHLRFEKEKFWLYKYDPSGPEQEISEYVEKYKTVCFPELNKESSKNLRAINISHLLSINEDLVVERRASCVELSGSIIHVALYLTVIKDAPEGVLFSIHRNYAPANSYIAPIHLVNMEWKTYPCTLYTTGKTLISNLGDVKKGAILLIDTTYFTKFI